MKAIGILLLIFFVTGCAAPRNARTEREKYYIGMPISEFKETNHKRKYELLRAYDNVEMYELYLGAFSRNKHLIFEDGVLREIDTKVEKEEPKIIVETKQSKTDE